MEQYSERKYVVVTWPESQIFMTRQGFQQNAYLINDEKGLEEFGSSAYFIDSEWLSANEKELSGWDFRYEEEVPDTAGANILGILTNGRYYLFFHVYADEEGQSERCHIYSSVIMDPENEECSYLWTSENDCILLQCLNELKDETDFCGEGSPIRSLQFKNSEE